MSNRYPDAPALPQRVELPGGLILTVRFAETRDLEALIDLFSALPAEDRYHRFFSMFRPTPEFVRSWIDASRHTGCLLVAELPPAGDGRAHIVAEAGYTKLPDGAAEFGVTVAKDWRGWLGPFLIDLLVDAARADGISVLEAEVLTENRAMRALTAARGDAVLNRPDWAVTRVAISTDGRVPPWPPHDARPRVLV